MMINIKKMKDIIWNCAYMMEGIKSSLSHSAYTGKLMNLVRIQRYAQKWEKTLLEKEQGYILGFKWLRRYCPVPKRWVTYVIPLCESGASTVIAPR